jgi:23S rRNA-intervening sequence protein
MFTISKATEQTAFTLDRRKVFLIDYFNIIQGTFPRQKQIGPGRSSRSKRLRRELRLAGSSINLRNREANGNGGFAITQFQLRRREGATLRPVCPMGWKRRRRAEGYGRFHYLDNAKFCSNSRGSCWEVLDHLITANDEGLLGTELLEQGRAHVTPSIKLLNGYMKYLKRAHTEEL